MRQRVAWRLGQLLAEQADPAAGRALGEIKQLEERGLASARWPGEKIEAAPRESEIEVAEDLCAGAVAKPDRIELGD